MVYSSLIKTGLLIVMCVLAGCASLAFQPDLPRRAYVAEGAGEFSRYMPIIVSEYPGKSYNRIGRPEAYMQGERLRIRVNPDPDTAVAYAEKRHFQTDHGSYTNLVYRIHFEKVPFSLLPFNLTMGRNVGLLLIITLNARQQPVLLTTVHTCGCYLAIVPTTYLPRAAYPENWHEGTQDVYGAELPAVLSFDNADAVERFVVYLRDATHRVIHLDIATKDEIASAYSTYPVSVQPVSVLDALPLPGQSQRVSMFEPQGSRRDYVRDSYKPFEFLFMGWWSLDSRVGNDKRYGKPGGESPAFYTSLKPWARQDSDMRDFVAFLRYWGWRL